MSDKRALFLLAFLAPPILGCDINVSHPAEAPPEKDWLRRERSAVIGGSTYVGVFCDTANGNLVYIAREGVAVIKDGCE